MARHDSAEGRKGNSFRSDLAVCAHREIISSGQQNSLRALFLPNGSHTYIYIYICMYVYEGTICSFAHARDTIIDKRTLPFTAHNATLFCCRFYCRFCCRCYCRFCCRCYHGASPFGKQMDPQVLEEMENMSLHGCGEKSDEKKSIRGKIRELELLIHKKIVNMQDELTELRQKGDVMECNYDDIFNEFKEDIKRKIEEVNVYMGKKIDEQNVKHSKLFNILVSLKNENSTINRSISLLNEKIHMLEEEIGE
ncbi:conserved Plasmodium protein, unknown function [Plasmodium ovale wallikeri]|uniref:Uncharacterized protein n=1 Tax=Plasmodium ovale wallikeri TaxID=864142 RepID=A0A1A8ZCU7_PLAOA|nr:conserved Plasmodium protein, unknown function [Plasmodium ovale wallikeri]